MVYSQDLIVDLVNNLGADIQFYQCFKLEDDDSKIIFNYNKQFIQFYVSKSFSQLKEKFKYMITELTCEKFIAVGHLLDTMFSMNTENAKYVREYLMYFFDEGIIDNEDVKHG